MSTGVKRFIINPLFVFGLVMLGGIGPLQAEEGLPASQAPAQPEKNYLLEDLQPGKLSKGLDYLERFQVWLGGRFEQSARQVDDYFGSEEGFERSKGNRLDVLTPIVFHDSGQMEMSVRLRTKIHLPRINDRLHLVLTTEDTSVKGQADDSLAREITEEDGRTAVGLQLALEKYSKLASLLDIGLSFKNIVDPDPYVRLKKNYEWTHSSGWVTRMGQTAFWERYEGVGLDSKLVFDKPLDTKNLFRSQTDGLWQYEEGTYSLTQRLLLYHTQTKHTLHTYQLRGDWNSAASTYYPAGMHLSGYGAFFNWRERAYKDWLFFEVEPGVYYSQDNDFKRADLTLLLLLEMRFYHTP